ncbi:MAG: exodeoxyribonuclease III [Puniceicoccales bacterium]|jgi:exodeoxyribonuclease-3|nr:exodeoxyribonuclease III [Puniceicoccales bacterium]
MRIITWNVNGLRSILQKTFGDFIRDVDPDILCLQETKVSPDVIPDLGFPQYGFRSFNCADRRGYSGTAMLSKFPPQFVDERMHLESLLPSHEGRVQVAEFKKFFLVNVYVPNAQAQLTRLALRHLQWDVEFAKYLSELDAKKPVLACGDFNVAHQSIDLARPEENRGNAGFTDEEREGFSNILKQGFVDVFRMKNPDDIAAYTWWSYRCGARARNVGWRIDYFLASQRIISDIGECRILSHVMGSDHAPVLLELQ